MHDPATLDVLEPGTTVDRYRIVRRLAVGGMAEIYLATATGIEGFAKRVVLKRILPSFACRPEFVGMFLDEARLAAQLHHPNIAQVYDIGCDGDSYYFTMELVDGCDVRYLCKRIASLDEDMPVDHAVAIVLGVAAGLHAAHEQRGVDGLPLGVVHRDVSAANVLVTFDGNIKLIDFGIAKASRRQTQTRTGVLKGKATSMSPEQCLAEPLDRRSDIFSLGILLYELVTGSRCFLGDSEFETMRRVVDGRYVPPRERRPELSAGLEKIIARALECDPKDRYQTGLELFVDLDCMAREERMSVSPYGLADYVARLFPNRDAIWEADASAPLFLMDTDAPLADEIEIDVILEGDDSEESFGSTRESEEDAASAGALRSERAKTEARSPYMSIRPRRRSSPGARSALSSNLALGTEPESEDPSRAPTALASSDTQELPASTERVTVPRNVVNARASRGKAAPENGEVDRAAASTRRLAAQQAGPPELPLDVGTSLVSVRTSRPGSSPIFQSRLSLAALFSAIALAGIVLAYGLLADNGWLDATPAESAGAMTSKPMIPEPQTSAAAQAPAAPRRSQAPAFEDDLPSPRAPASAMGRVFVGESEGVQGATIPVARPNPARSENSIAAPDTDKARESKSTRAIEKRYKARKKARKRKRAETAIAEIRRSSAASTRSKKSGLRGSVKTMRGSSAAADTTNTTELASGVGTEPPKAPNTTTAGSNVDSAPVKNKVDGATIADSEATPTPVDKTATGRTSKRRRKRGSAPRKKRLEPPSADPNDAQGTKREPSAPAKPPLPAN